MPCVALWGVLRAFWVCRRVGYSHKDIKARGVALKCDYGDLALFREVARGQKKDSSSGTDTAEAAFFVAGEA